MGGRRESELSSSNRYRQAYHARAPQQRVWVKEKPLIIYSLSVCMLCLPIHSVYNNASYSFWHAYFKLHHQPKDPKSQSVRKSTMRHYSNSNLFFLFLASLIIFTSHQSLFTICRAAHEDSEEVGDETPFTYIEGTGKGPKNWGQIDPHWKVCDNGTMQSPIDLLDKRVQVFPNLGKLKKDYQPAPATVKNRGHDITVRWKGDAGKININGTDYRLLQCHWHSSSEHTFNGSRYDLELHIIHLDSGGQIAVIGIVYKYGRPDPFLSKLFHHIKSVGSEEVDIGTVNPGDIKFGSRKYYRYIGSLTVPPCTEGVVWSIIKKVRTVSREQVHALRNTVHDGFEANARPTQQLDGRAVLLYTPKETEGSG